MIRLELGVSSQGSSAPVCYYLCLDDSVGPARPRAVTPLVLACWAEGDRFLSLEEAHDWLAFHRRLGLRADVVAALERQLDALDRAGGQAGERA